MDTIYRSRASEVAALVRAHPSGAKILARLNETKWNTAQSLVAPERASAAVGAFRYFESRSRAELATTPASVQIRAAHPALWVDCDLGHVAHMLRLSNCSAAERLAFLQAVTPPIWLAGIYNCGSIGPLCGALISLSNYLDDDYREMILTPELGQRVLRELTLPFSESAKDSARAICLLGGFQTLGGRLPSTPLLEWQNRKSVDWLLEGLRAKTDLGIIGMYELQFWLGLRELARIGRAPERVMPQSGDNFLSRLEASDPPTEFARRTKVLLLAWLQKCCINSWILTP